MKAFASAATLAEMSQLDRKTVLLSLKRLEDSGLIRRLDETRGRGGAPVFELAMTACTDTEIGSTSEDETSTENGTTSSAEPVPLFPRTSTVFPTNPSRFSHEPVPKTGYRTSTSIEPVNEPVKRRRPKADHTHLPDDFDVSPRVRTWAEGKGFASFLEAHLEQFTGYAKANGKTYADWDQAFMNAITGDWGDVRKKLTTGNRNGNPMHADDIFKDSI